MASRASRERRRERKTKVTLQYSHDYFDYFHRDAPYPGIPARRAIFQTFPIPRWVSTRRPDPSLNPSRPLGPQARDRRGQEFWRFTRTDAGEGREVDAEVRQRLEALGIEIGNILGAGSQGLAIGIKLNGKRMVIKYATDIQSMVVEMWAMKEMAGARHIVQRRWIPGLSDSGVGRLSEDVMNNLIAGEEDHQSELARLLNIDLSNQAQRTLMYAMEYMKYGNMNGLLRKVSEMGARLNSRELWRVFYCLFRACIGLAYVGGRIVLTSEDGWDEGLDPETGQDILTQEEFVPCDATDQLLETHEGLVNFDVNERNVMLGTVPEEDMNRGDDAEHSHDEVPVFKIGDLGIIRAFRGFHRDSMLALASSRVLGNQWCQTPEQFTQSWNYYGAAAADIDALNADDTAGKYDWWTNLWQVARLMTIMVTQYQPEIPPDCLRVPITKPGGTTEAMYTYGSELLDEDLYSHYDLILRSTLAWCLAHRPRDRPTMSNAKVRNLSRGDVERIIEDGIARKYPEEDQEERVTMAQLLSQPVAALRSTPVQDNVLGDM